MRKKVVAPFDGRLQRPLTSGQIPGTLVEQRQVALHPREHRGGAEQTRPRCRELDGEGQAVQPCADLGHLSDVRLVEREVRSHGGRTVGEQGHRVAPGEFLDRRRGARIGHGQGHHPELLLPSEAQGRAARHDDLRTCGDGQQPSNVVRRLQDLLEVVEDQQQLALRDEILQRLAGRPLPPLLADADGRGDGRDHEGRIADRREVDEGDPVGKRGGDRGRDAHGEPGLPRPSRPGQREQVRSPEQLDTSRDLPFPPHERGRLGGEVHRDLERPERGELVEEPVDHHIVEMLGLNEVLEPMDPLASNRDAVGKLVMDQRPSGVGQDDLPTPSRRADARRPVHIEPDVVVPAEDPLAGMHAHAHPKRASMRPLLGGEGSLRRHGGPQRLATASGTSRRRSLPRCAPRRRRARRSPAAGWRYGDPARLGTGLRALGAASSTPRCP